MKCFYHSADLDGICSGAIVHQAYPDCEMIGYDYGQPFPWASIAENEPVWMVDVSLPATVMTALAAHADLTWIDHHKSAIEELQGLRIKGVQVVGMSGCELAWMYIHGLPAESMPRAVRLLGRYDVWDHGYSRDVMPFQHGMRGLRLTVSSWQWKQLLLGDDRALYTQIVMEGERALVESKARNAEFSKKYAFECTIHGLRAIALNKLQANSQTFESVYDAARHDLMMAFGFCDGSMRVSFYSDKQNVDCSVLAKQWGGGGHKGAAGFRTTMFPFWDSKGDQN